MGGVKVFRAYIGLDGLLKSRLQEAKARSNGEKIKKVHILLTTCMKIYPAYISGHLVKANVIEPFKARPRYLTHSMVRNKKRFLPPHEEIFPLSTVFVMKVGLFGLFGQWPPCGKPAPVVHVCLVRRSPRLMSGLKSVFWTNNFAFEIGGQRRMLRSKTCNKSISRQFNASQPHHFGNHLQCVSTHKAPTRPY